MSPHHAAHFNTALEALELILAPAGGWLPVTLWRPGRERQYWHRCGQPGGGARLARLVAECDLWYSDEISFGLPMRERFGPGVVSASVLWARIEGTEQLRRARAFKPLPSMVLQEGASSRRLLLWSLREPLDYWDVEQLNKRLAYRLRAVQKHADPDRLRIPAPGTCLRNRSRPLPVVVGRLTTASYRPMEVAGRLKDPPDVRWWEKAG